MKESITRSLKTIAGDRWIVGLMIANVLMAIVISVILLIMIEPSESQVITRYTSYGGANFYRGYWYELFGYVLLALAIAIGHSAISVKLANRNRRELAIMFLWLTMGILLMLFIFARSVLKVASLG